MRSFWRTYNIMMILFCVAMGVGFVVLGFLIPITALGMWIGAAACFFSAAILGVWHVFSKDLIPDMAMVGPTGSFAAMANATAHANAMTAAMTGMSPYADQQLAQMLPGQARVDRADATGFGGPTGRVVDLHLTVTLPGRTPYQVMQRETVPPAAEATIVPGSVLGVRANPNNRHQMVIDLPGR